MFVRNVMWLLTWAVLPVASTHSGFIVNIVESGNDVVATFSGSANTSGLGARQRFKHSIDTQHWLGIRKLGDGPNLAICRDHQSSYLFLHGLGGSHSKQWQWRPNWHFAWPEHSRSTARIHLRDPAFGQQHL